MKRLLFLTMLLNLCFWSSALEGQTRNFTKVWDGGLGGAGTDPPNLVKAWGVVAGFDLDNDGNLEFASFDATLKRIIVWESQGTGLNDYAVVWHMDKNLGAWGESILYGPQRSIMITDLDEDGNLELTVIWDAFHPDLTDGFNALEIYEHNPTSGEFLQAEPTHTYDPPRNSASLIRLEFQSQALDVDGDGTVELILTHRGGQNIILSIISMTGKDFSAPAWVVEYVDSTTTSDSTRYGMKVHSMTVGDLDGDGKQDMLVQTDGDNMPIVVYTATAANSYTSVMFESSDYHADYRGSAAKLVMADMNGDGNTEVYLGARGGKVWVISGITDIATAFNAANFTLIANLLPEDISKPELRGGALGDADNNGKNSFYVTARDPLEAIYEFEWLGGTTGDVAEPENYQMFKLYNDDNDDGITVGFVAMAIGDYDGDGVDHQDIVFVTGNGNEGVKPGIYVIEHFLTIPSIAVSPDTLDFGPVSIGFPDTLSVNVTNTGFAPLQITGISLAGAGFTANTDTLTLDIKESHDIYVALEATAVQAYSGSLTITSNDPDNPTATVVLQGQGMEPPDIAVSPDSLSDTLLTGASSVQYLTIDNTGSSDLAWEISLENLGLGTVTFTKEDYADWTLPENQDRITDNVWITRANTQGIFNAATETGYSYYVSPDNTEWAYGLTEELEPDDYEVWRDAVSGRPPDMVGQPISLHLITDDIYFDVLFHSWTCCDQGGGFSYTRSEDRPRWLSVSPDSGVTAAGNSQQVGVNFDAIGLDAGGHDAVIVLNSNDPDEGVISIPVHLDVTGASDIYTAIDTLDFGQVFVNYADSLELLVENRGTEDLWISPVVPDPGEYTVSPASAAIYPDDSKVFLIKFTPTSVGDYPGTLTFTTTDPDEGTYVITLLGEGIEPPIADVSPDSLAADLFTNDTTQQVLTISNTGASDLVYEIWATAASDGEPDAQSPHLARATSTVTTDAKTDRSLKDLLGDLLPKPQLQGVKDSPVNKVAATPQAIAGNPVWRLLYTDPDEPSLELDIQNVYGAATLDEVLFKVNTYEPLSGEDYYELIIIIDADQDTLTGLDIDDLIGYGWQLGADYLIILEAYQGETYGALLRFVLTPYGWGFEEVDILTTGIVDLVANEIILGVNTQHLEDYSAINFTIEAYLGGGDLVPDQGAGHISFPLSPPWLRLSAAGGVIPAGGQEDVTVTFDAAGMFGGDYQADILVVSNDPVTPELPVPTRLGVTGIPIYAGPDRVDFDASFKGYLDSTYLILDNVGTDILEITNIVPGDAHLTVKPDSLSIAPVSSDTLTLYLLADSEGDFSTTVSFSTNDANSPEIALPVVSTVLIAPDISVTPMELSFIDTVAEVSSDTISISNEGGSDLTWEIQLESVGLGTVTFTKEDYADWTLPENQDRITDNVWITRANTQGIFNAATESYYNWNSPDDTEWAYGLTEELEPGDYQIWRDAVGSYPPGMVGQPISMHLISDDIYFDVLFHSWTSMGNGGGFSYTRTDAEPRWLDVSQESGIVSVGSTVNIVVVADLSVLEVGEYLAQIVISSNDPDEPDLVVSVTSTATTGAIPVSIAEHDNNSVILSVFNNGVVGASRGEEGSGFLYSGLNGLFEGNLTIATFTTSDSLIVGGLYERDFTPLSMVEPIESNLPDFDLAYRATFGDHFAFQPLGIRVVQRSHSKSTSPDDDYVIMEYVILNDGTEDMSAVYIGLGLDWDVGDYANNLGGYDAGHGMSYTYESGDGTNANYYGSVALSGPVSGHTITISGRRDFMEYYQALTDFIDMPDSSQDCRSQLTVGPYDLQVGDSVLVAFAILGGDNLDDLVANAAAAQAVWATVGIADHQPYLPTEFALHQNYPNPFNPVSTIRYEVPQASHLSLVVYDLLGREVVRLVDSYIEPGYQQVVWNGRDRLGREVSSGIYIARLHIPPAAGATPEYTKSIKMVLLK